MSESEERSERERGLEVGDIDRDVTGMNVKRKRETSTCTTEWGVLSVARFRR